MIKLKCLGELLVGATPGPAGAGDALVRYVRGGSIRDGELVEEAESGPPPTRGREAQAGAGDVLVRARGAPITAVVASGAAGAYPTNDVLLFRPDRSKVEPRFVTVALNLPRARDTLSAGSQGAALSRLSIGTLGSLKISVPPLETQRKIAALADCMEAERRLLERLRELHRQLNQQILQRLLGNAHDEGGNPRRGSHQADGPEGPSVSPHLEVRNT